MKKNDRKARNQNIVDPKNVKKNEPIKNNILEKSKDKVVQFSNNSLGQQCFGCQGYGHVRSECTTYLKSKDKVMAITLSDNEESDHKSKSYQEGNFMVFTTTDVVGESEIVEENQSDGKLSKNADLQEAYNKLCKIATKDAMNVNQGLKNINTLEHEKKNLSVKLFDANVLIIAVKIENMSLIKKVKILDLNYLLLKNKLVGIIVLNLIIC